MLINNFKKICFPVYYDFFDEKMVRDRHFLTIKAQMHIKSLYASEIVIRMNYHIRICCLKYQIFNKRRNHWKDYYNSNAYTLNFSIKFEQIQIFKYYQSKINYVWFVDPINCNSCHFHQHEFCYESKATAFWINSLKFPLIKLKLRWDLIEFLRWWSVVVGVNFPIIFRAGRE